MMVSGGFTVFRWGPAYFLAPHCGTTPPKKPSDPAQFRESVCACVCSNSAFVRIQREALSSVLYSEMEEIHSHTGEL